MAKVTILYWEEIPSVVEAKQGRSVHKEMLSERFQELIDMIAMKKKLAGTDEYLTQWNKGQPYEVEGAVEEVVKQVKEDIESKYKEIQKREMEKVRSKT